MDRDRAAEVAAAVVAELRARGFDLPPAPRSAAASAAPWQGPAAGDFRAPDGAPPGGALRPHDPGVSPAGRPTVTCNVSNRHIHLTQEHLEVLFGAGAQLTPRNSLMQPFQFAAKETVSLIAGRGRAIENVRILGPLRKYTQVEISRTDGYFLGIKPPVRESGNIKGSAPGTLVGPKGTLVLKEGIIVADRHIHTPPDVAARFGLANNQMILARIHQTEKPTLMEQVRIRISDEFLFEMHIDTDDANASGLVNGDRVELVL